MNPLLKRGFWLAAASALLAGVLVRPDAAAQGFEIGAQPGGRIPEFGQRHLPLAAFQRVDAPEKPRRVGPECPGDVTAFQSFGQFRLRQNHDSSSSRTRAVTVSSTSASSPPTLRV